MKTILSFFILAVAAISGLAQDTTPTPKPADTTTASESKEPVSKIEEPGAVCDLTIPNSPIVHGLKLQMPEAEASLKLLRTPFEPDSADAKVKRVTVKFEKPEPPFENVLSASLTAKGEKVTSIKLEYSTKWPTVKDFVQKAAPSLGVVRIGFRIDPTRNEAKMVCKDFSVELRSGDSGSALTLTDLRN